MKLEDLRKKQAELLVMVISKQYCSVLSVQLLLSNSSHVLAAVHCAYNQGIELDLNSGVKPFGARAGQKAGF